jgi:hypothetical protein
MLSGGWRGAEQGQGEEGGQRAQEAESDRTHEEGKIPRLAPGRACRRDYTM